MPNTKRKKKAATNKTDENHIAKMEKMAEIAVGISGNPTPTEIAAMLYFRDLNERLTLEQCRTVMDETSNEFLLCMMTESALLMILRKWTILEPSIKKQFFEYFFSCVLLKYRKIPPVRREMLGACCKLIKRSVFDGHACTFDSLATKFYVMLTDASVEIHQIMYEFFLKILDEFDTYWRITDLGISYDFQYKAKISFENDGLLQIFCKCIHIVPRHCILVSSFKEPAHLSMTEYFLRITNIIFARNYGIHHIPRRKDMSVKGPPKTWKSIFFWSEFLQLFFSLHRFLRRNDSLSMLTTGCITQLTSISSVVLPDVAGNLESEMISFPSIYHAAAYNRYTSDLLALFIWTFNTRSMMPDVYGHCLMINNILSNHPIQSLALAEASFTTFISLIPLLTESFTLKLSYMNEKSENEDAKKDEEEERGEVVKKRQRTIKWTCFSAIQHLFKGWLIILQNSALIAEVMNYAIDFGQITIVIISSFMQMIFSVPFGDREEVSVPLPDREIFKEILTKIGTFSSYFLDEMLSKMYTILTETMEEFLSTLETGISVEDLENFRENMHWALLLIGHILVEEDEERNLVWQKKLLVYYEDVIVRKTSTNIDKYPSYMEACINTPQLLTDPPEIDLVLKIVGTVFAWCSIEDTLLKDHGETAINVELCSTSLWCARRLLSAIGLHIQKSTEKNRLIEVSENITQILVDFALQKSFRVFEVIPNVRRTCRDAVDLLATLSRTLYRETSKSIFLFSYLSAIKTDHVLVRALLIKALLQIGSIIDDEVKQKSLFEMILVPIRTKFIAICENSLETDDKLDDLLDCFCAVIHGTQKCYATFLLEYLKPTLKHSVLLLSLYKNSAIIVNAVLQFFECLTKRMDVFCDNHEDMAFLYEVLLSVLQVYEREQKERYANLDDRTKASELILLLEILVNTLDKRNRPVNLLTGEVKSVEDRAYIAATLWNMIIYIIEPEFFKVPLLRKSFYRFLRCSAEATPECITTLLPENFTIIVEYLKKGLQPECEKDDLLCNLKDRFEKEISINSAIAIAHLGTYFTKHARNDTAIRIFSFLIEPTFTICLNALWQDSDLSSATSEALYSLLRCNEDGCRRLVKSLLAREANNPNRTTLRVAFRTLMSSTPGKSPEKYEKRKFYDRLKEFLTKVEGLLVVE